jgi:hypothetical protein
MAGNLLTTWATTIVHGVIERRGRVVNIPSSYSGGPGFNFGPEAGILTEVFRGFPQSL